MKEQLWIAYNDKLWSFQDFLDKDISVIIPHSKIWNIAIQSFKFLQRLSLHKLNKVFVERDCIYSVRYGTSSVLFLTRKNLKHFAKENEGFWNVQYFQNSPPECPCRLCKSYLPQVVFIWVTKIKISTSFSKLSKCFQNIIVFMFYCWILIKYILLLKDFGILCPFWWIYIYMYIYIYIYIYIKSFSLCHVSFILSSIKKDREFSSKIHLLHVVEETPLTRFLLH